jgi:hypothetical protein
VIDIIVERNSSDGDNSLRFIDRKVDLIENEDQIQDMWATDNRLQPSSVNQPYLFQANANEIHCSESNIYVDLRMNLSVNDDIKVDCFTNCNFFLRRFSDITEAAHGSQVNHLQIKECCTKNQKSAGVSSNAVFGLIFRYVIDDSIISERISSSSSISSSEYEDRISSSITSSSRRQVETCVIKALKKSKQGRPKAENGLSMASNAVDCMGADGAFMRRFNNLYDVATTFKLDAANLSKALGHVGGVHGHIGAKRKNGHIGGFYWRYYQGDDDPSGPGVGEVLLLHDFKFFFIFFSHSFDLSFALVMNSSNCLVTCYHYSE